MTTDQQDMLTNMAPDQALSNGHSSDLNSQNHGSGSQDQYLTDRQRFNWLRLIRCDNVGPATFHDLCAHFGSAEKALDALPTLSRRGGAKKSVRIATQQDVETEWNQIYQGGARLVALGEPDYPQDLAHIHAPPPLLTIVGDGQWSHKTAVAIVGSRNCSASGLKLTQNIARDLGQKGIVIASGLARGIDTEAHKASLYTGTIAIVAGGLNRIYPKENIKLAHAIAENGLLVSEMPWNWQARAQDFPRRNRIISGVAAGTLVIEAAKRSGSLITARYALEQGREVFAIPGSPLDPRSDGTNHLIKQGACLVCEADDILAALPNHTPSLKYQPPLLRENASSSEPFDFEDALPVKSRDRFIQSLGPTPIAIDELVRQSGVSPSQAQIILLELDLAGRLERHGNQAVSLKP
ncbi:DNA-processing protein DprA [Cohaesibacter celericrescens]|nr:DNA-processing protein DprA [Cohaesibacter celericrescens]